MDKITKGVTTQSGFLDIKKTLGYNQALEDVEKVIFSWLSNNFQSRIDKGYTYLGDDITNDLKELKAKIKEMKNE